MNFTSSEKPPESKIERDALQARIAPDAVKGRDNLTDPDHVSPLLTEMLKEFDRLAGKHPGLVTNRQLGEIMEDPTRRGADAAVALALYKTNHDLQSGSTPLDGKPDLKGLTRQELLSISEKALHAPASCLTQASESAVNINPPDLWAGIQFVLAHKSEDQRIFQTDVEKSLATTIGDAATRQSLTFLKDHFSEIATEAGHPAGFGLTFQDLKNFATTYSNTCTPLWNMRGILISHAQVVKEGVPTALYATPSEPEKSISHKGIEQTMSSDCYFESPTGAFADAHKDVVQKMIHDDGNQKFTVTFPNTSQHYTVTQPTEAERIMFNKGGTEGNWATVIEKAFGLRANDVNHTGAVQHSWEVPAEYSSDFGHSKEVMSLYSGGREVKSTYLDGIDQAKLQSQLSNDFTHAKAVIANRERWNFKNDELVDLPVQHTYEVVAYDSTGADGGVVTIRNPWAGADGTYAGQFTMSLKQFSKSFNEIEEEP